MTFINTPCVWKRKGSCVHRNLFNWIWWKWHCRHVNRYMMYLDVRGGR